MPLLPVVPELVSDVNLERSRVELQDGSTAIKVTETTPADLTPITDTLGETTDTIADSTVIGLLKQEVAKTTDLSTLESTSSTIATTQGSVSDAAWSGTGDATVISLLKGIVNKLN